MKEFEKWFEKYKNLHSKQYWPNIDFHKHAYEKG